MYTREELIEVIVLSELTPKQRRNLMASVKERKLARKIRKLKVTSRRKVATQLMHKV